MNRSYFIARVRKSVFGGRIGQSQIDGLNYLLDVREQRFSQVSRYELAYVLATIFHETGATMRPIREKGGTARFTRLYDIRGARPNVARRLGNVKPGDGARYPGMGYVQNTGRANARKGGGIIATVLGERVDFEADPALLMQPKYSAVLAYYGMIHGSYTGRKLSDYVSDTHQDYVGARAIINGKDKAGLVAGYATAFLDALTQAEEQPNAAAPVAFVATPADEHDIEPADDSDDDYVDMSVLDAGATGKSLATSKTAWAAATSGVAGGVAVAKEAVDQAQDVIATASQSADVATSAWTLTAGLGPWLIAGAVIAVAVGVVIYERHRHSIEYGV